MEYNLNNTRLEIEKGWKKINFEMTETRDSDILVARMPVKLGRFLNGKKM